VANARRRPALEIIACALESVRFQQQPQQQQQQQLDLLKELRRCRRKVGRAHVVLEGTLNFLKCAAM
jgi:hypothetical protein